MADITAPMNMLRGLLALAEAEPGVVATAWETNRSHDLREQEQDFLLDMHALLFHQEHGPSTNEFEYAIDPDAEKMPDDL